MSSISVNTITDASGGSTTSINGLTPTVSNMAGRNRIINGDMRIDQRNAGASVTLGTSSSAYGADRFMVEQGGVTANTGTVQQVSDAPTGFKKSIKYTGGSATYNSQGFAAINQRIEGLNLADSDYGTASAKQFTLSFWVKASVTGTYSINFTHYDGSNERWLLQTYIVDSANTWEKKTITINGDTAYSIPADNGATGWMRVYWALGGDSNSMQGTVTGNWVAGSGSNRAVSGQVNVATTSGATFYITGVQLEEGSVATPFEHRQYGQELALCQRYYQKISLNANPEFWGTGYWNTTTGVQIYTPFITPMRAAPTALETSGVPSQYSVRYTGGRDSLSAGPTFGAATTFGINIGATSSAARTAGNGTIGTVEVATFLAWSAEL